MRWLVIPASLVLAGGATVEAWILPERQERAMDWRAIVLKQPLTISEEDFAKLRENVLADPFLKAASDPATDLQDKPAAEAIAALRERLRQPNAGSSLHLSLGDRLWEHYSRTGDMEAGREAVESWLRWVDTDTNDPTRPLRLARRLAGLELWEAAVPMLRRAAAQCPPGSAAELREVARMFHLQLPEVEAELECATGSTGEQERLMRAIVAWEAGAKDQARRLLATVHSIPASHRGLLVRLRAEVAGVENDVLSLRSFMTNSEPGSPTDPVWEVKIANALATMLGAERAALVDGAIAHLRKGSAFANDFDYLLAAACASLETRPADTAFLLSARQKRTEKPGGESASLTIFRALEAARTDDAIAWRAAFKSLPPSSIPDLIETTFAALGRERSLEKHQAFFEGVAQDVNPGLAVKTPENLGRLGLWLLLAGRHEEAAKHFEDGLGKPNRIDDRLALAFGLAVARQKSGDNDAALRTFTGLQRDRAGAVLLALLVESSMPGLRQVQQALNLARAEALLEEARSAAGMLHLDLRGRGVGEWPESFPQLDGGFDTIAGIEKARREWPMLRLPPGSGHLHDVVKNHFAELEPLLREMAEQRAQTAAALHVKANLAVEVLGSISDRQSPATAWGQKLQWSAYDDARALEVMRRKTLESREKPLPRGSLESGIWRHRFGEWDRVAFHGIWVNREAVTPWTTPLEESARTREAASHRAFEEDLPESNVRILRMQVLRDFRSRVEMLARESSDANAVAELRGELMKRLDDSKAGYDERLAILTAAGLGNEAFILAQDQLSSGRLTVDQAVRTVAAPVLATSFSKHDQAGFQAAYKKQSDLKEEIGGWLLDHAGQWPEKKRAEWYDLISSRAGGVLRMPKYAEHLRESEALHWRSIEAAPKPAEPMAASIENLKTVTGRSAALDTIERAVRGGTPLTSGQCTSLADLGVSWLFGDAQTRSATTPVEMRIPLGLSPPPDVADHDPDSAARALVIASVAHAREGWRPDPPTQSGYRSLVMRERERWLPQESEALPGTRFLPANVLLNAARMENMSPVTLSEWRRAPYSHECRYQNLVRWLDEQARARRTPEDVPFRLLALQFRWTGRERRAAALLAWDWFRLSPYADLRHVACQLLQQTTYDRAAATLALGLLGSADFPADRAMMLFANSLAKLPSAEREGPIKKLAEQDGMKALLASAAISRAAAAKPAPAVSSTSRRIITPQPGQPMSLQTCTEVAADRRFLESLTDNGREACALFEEELKSNWPRGGAEIGSAPTAEEERRKRWARLLQSAHWLESTGLRFAVPPNGGGSVKKSTPEANRLVTTSWAESETTGVFLDMLRASEPAGENPVWKKFPPVQALEPPCWLRLVRMEDKAGDAVFRFDISKDGDQWREVETARWPHLGTGITLGIANLSAASVPYEDWKFDGFKTPDPSRYTWTRGGAVPGKLPGYRHYGPLKPLPPSGTLPEWPGDGGDAFGDAFYGLGRHVIGEGSMVVRLPAAPPGGRAGLFIQKDWFAGGTRIMATLDAAGQFEMTQRLGRTDGVDLWKKLAATEATRGGAAWWMRRYLLALVELRLDEEAWSAAGRLGDRELVRLMAFGCADMLATIHSTSPGKAAAFADRLLELGGAQSGDPGIRNCMEIAFRILAGKLPGETAGDQTRIAAVDAFLEAGAGDRPRIPPKSRRGGTAGEEPDLASSFAPRTIEIAPGAALSPREALDTLIAASRDNAPRSAASNRTSHMGLALMDTCYHPDTGLIFTLVQKSLSLRGTAEAAAALEEFPWQNAASTDPPPDASLPDRVLPGVVVQIQRFRSQLGFALRLALGEEDAARALPESLPLFLPMPLGLPPGMAKQVLANCLHAGGFENEAIRLQRELLQEINKPWPECRGYSFDVPLRLALWSKDRSARSEALDHFVALVRRQKRAAPYDAMFRLAIRKGADLLRKDHRDKEAKELEAIASTEF
jgi:tetratricopeptide (TPR) repeat protein